MLCRARARPDRIAITSIRRSGDKVASQRHRAAPAALRQISKHVAEQARAF